MRRGDVLHVEEEESFRVESVEYRRGRAGEPPDHRSGEEEEEDGDSEEPSRSVTMNVGNELRARSRQFSQRMRGERRGGDAD